MQEERDGNRYTRIFQTFGEFIEVAETGTTTLRNHERASQRDEMLYWYGNTTFKESIELAKSGWPEGLSRITQKLDLVSNQLPTKKLLSQLTMAQVGPGTLDLQRLNQEHPAPWVTYIPTETEVAAVGQIVTMCVSLSASSSVTSEQLFEKGAVTVALIDLLEKNNKRVELWFTMSTGSLSSSITIKTLVKPAGEILDLERIAYAIAHTSCFRRLGFSQLEQAPEDIRDKVGIHIGHGYGMPKTITMPDAVNINAANAYEFNFSSIGSIMTWMQTILTPYGINLSIPEDYKALKNKFEDW